MKSVKKFIATILMTIAMLTFLSCQNDNDTKIIPELNFDYIGEFNDGLAIVRIGEITGIPGADAKWGFVDTNGII